jgi:Raf kinase inhibitor-like YbhB/YbcL family protein
MELISTAFKDGGIIPRTYTCDGANISPPLRWKHVPAGTRSLALICEDPDAPGGSFIHWVVFNIPPTIDHLGENVSHAEYLPVGAVQGKNDFGKAGYGGPCPPSGTHGYAFQLYALDTIVEMRPGTTVEELRKEIDGHMLDACILTGNYKRIISVEL